MKIKINGEEKEFSGDSMTVAELLKAGDVETPEMVSVQLNGSFIDKKDYASTAVSENDDIDFLYFMGGGSV
jgi:sulfur carrier protein